MLSYPSGMSLSSRTLRQVADILRAHRRRIRSRRRRLSAGRQARLVLAQLRKGETYADLACGFRIGTSTVYRYLREAIDLLAAQAPTLEQAIAVAARKAFVTLDGTLLRIDRVGMAGGRDRVYYSGKHKCHGVNVQVLADPIGRLVWISPAAGVTPRHGRRTRAGIIDALNTAGVRVIADRDYQGGGPAIEVPQRRRRLDPDTGRYRRLWRNQKAVDAAHARQRGPGERTNAELKNWRVLPKIRSCPYQASQLVAAIQTLMITEA